MNISYLIGLISSLLCISPSEDLSNGKMLVAQFDLYVDTNYYHDTGKVLLDFEVRYDRRIYGDDCQAFYDLSLNRDNICSLEEMQRIAEVLRLQKQNPHISNKL